MFVSLDLLQLEINPWATNEKNELYCIDGKLNVDDNALFRQPELVKMKENSLGSEEVDVHEQQVHNIIKGRQGWIELRRPGR